MSLYLVLGITGCILMASGDYMMIYGNTAYEGKLAWLTLGTAEIPYTKNALSMAVAFPAVIFYLTALFAVRHFIFTDSDKKTYIFSTCVGMLPWLSLHLFYVMILYTFARLCNEGLKDTAYMICESLFSQFSWIIIVSEIMMLLPFAVLIFFMLAGKTIFPGWMALNNPLTYYIILKIITAFLEDTPARLAFVNGLMSESMALWFLVFIIFFPVYSKRQKLFIR